MRVESIGIGSAFSRVAANLRPATYELQFAKLTGALGPGEKSNWVRRLNLNSTAKPSLIGLNPPLAQTLLLELPAEDKLMKIPPRKLTEWIEYYWLLLSNPSFQSAQNKRKAYFEYRLAKVYNTPFY